MRTLAVTLSVVGLVALSSPASAKDLTGRFGLGYNTNLPSSTGALNAISGRYWLDGRVGIEGEFGFTTFHPKTGDTATGLGLGFGGLYNFVDETNMHVFGSATAMFGQVPVTTATGVDQNNAFGLNVGVGSEFFFADLPNLGFTTGVGLTLWNITDYGTLLSLNGADYAQLGIRYYFGGPGAHAPK